MSVLKRGLIVSCQATATEPLRDSEIIGRLALAAQEGGAVGVRVNTYEDLVAVRKACNLPILGLIKTTHEGYWPYITTTMEDVDLVVKSGAELVCIDATTYPRYDGHTFAEQYKMVREKYPNIEIVADVSTVEEGLIADELGCDYIATTLWGYTPDTDTREDIIQEFRQPNVEIVRELASKCKHPIIAEGRFFNAENAIKAMKAGAYAVTIGWGITRPQIITEYIVTQMKKEIPGL